MVAQSIARCEPSATELAFDLTGIRLGFDDYRRARRLSGFMPGQMAPAGKRLLTYGALVYHGYGILAYRSILASLAARKLGAEA